MKTPEEIKKGLEYCQQGEDKIDCMGCIYLGDCFETHCFAPIASDALAYIQRLETERDESQRLLAKTYDELEEANKRLDGAENCTNCAYGDGTVNGTAYCYDCRLFTDEATRIKWTEGETR